MVTKNNFELEKKVIDTNVMGFTKVVIWAYNYFIKQGKGHLVIISSVAGHRGSKNSPTYSASKAYQMNFIEGLWHRSYKLKLPIIITDVRPGFVKTAMAKGDYIFWATSAENAASQIYKAIRKKRKVIYVTKRWFIIALLLKILPNRLYKLG